MFAAIREIDSGPEGRRFEEQASRIEAPTQIIWGEHDEVSSGYVINHLGRA